MKPQLLIRILILALAMNMFQACRADNTPDHLTGTWVGMFMQDYPTTLVFKKQSSGHEGRVQMTDGVQQIQDDELTDISLQELELSFFIPAKDTEFKGKLNEELSEISGIFIFPDGSEHAFNAKLKK